ncbi:spore germination protein [Neobacillus sp. YX16]|uniref:spore germination protein n=1 Tax=Neobacillus sp. YX16 TaxID=3047874 RepID=UPI0024C3CF1E|nr:spore germination protein [Neobacillus sp. YX16]WHZ03820.1 spore germination protein [Neobacillus sp. YX16]
MYPKQKEDSNRKPKTISYNIQTNLEQVKEELQSCSDLVIRELDLGNFKKAALVHIQGISDRDSISDNVVNPLLEKFKNTNFDKTSDSVLLDELKRNTFTVSQVKTETKWTVAAIL